MEPKHRSLSAQSQEAHVLRPLPSKGLAPICREALTKHWKGRPPRQVWRILRQIVFERDGQSCVYCGKRTGTLTCDHVIPVSRGGSSTFENLVTACEQCNRAKGRQTPEEWCRSGKGQGLLWR